MNGQEWRLRAACRSLPDLDAPFATDDRLQADFIRVCQHCPVRTDCLEFALACNDADGIYGGLTVDQRRIVQRRRGRPPLPCGTDAGYRRHRRHGEVPCGSCSAAHSRTTAEYQRTRRASA